MDSVFIASRFSFLLMPCLVCGDMPADKFFIRMDPQDIEPTPMGYICESCMKQELKTKNSPKENSCNYCDRKAVYGLAEYITEQSSGRYVPDTKLYIHDKKGPIICDKHLKKIRNEDNPFVEGI